MKPQVEFKQKITYQDVVLTQADDNLILEFVPRMDGDDDSPRMRVLLDVASAEQLVTLLIEHLASRQTEPAEEPAQTTETHPINWEEYEGRIPPDQLDNLKQFIGAFEPAPGFTIERLLAEEVYYPDDSWIFEETDG
jgi:hypothetical protein